MGRWVFPVSPLGYTVFYKKHLTEEILMQEIKKLYSAFSVRNIDNEYTQVDWYNADFKISSVDYEEIISGYNGMTPEEKRWAECVVDEFFTFDEIKLLEQFFTEKVGIKLNVVEHTFPIILYSMDDFGEISRRSSKRESEDLKGTNTIQLNKMDNYDLPFKVWGFIYQDNSTSSTEIPEKIITEGIGHNEMANQTLLTDPLDEEAIVSLLEDLAVDRVHLDEETTVHELLEAIAEGRVHFVTVNSFEDFDISNMKKITIH